MKMLKSRDAAAFLNISQTTLLALIEAGKIPATDVGTKPNRSHWRVDEADLIKYIEAGRHAR